MQLYDELLTVYCFFFSLVGLDSLRSRSGLLEASTQTGARDCLQGGWQTRLVFIHGVELSAGDDSSDCFGANVDGLLLVVLCHLHRWTRHPGSLHDDCHSIASHCSFVHQELQRGIDQRSANCQQQIRQSARRFDGRINELGRDPGKDCLQRDLPIQRER